MFNHVTVLLNEAVEGLNVKPDGIYVDCTLGGAGHSSLILKQLTTGHLYCFIKIFMRLKLQEKDWRKLVINLQLSNPILRI